MSTDKNTKVENNCKLQISIWGIVKDVNIGAFTQDGYNLADLDTFDLWEYAEDLQQSSGVEWDINKNNISVDILDENNNYIKENIDKIETKIEGCDIKDVPLIESQYIFGERNKGACYFICSSFPKDEEFQLKRLRFKIVRYDCSEPFHLLVIITYTSSSGETFIFQFEDQETENFATFGPFKVRSLL
jgi:hypothetical protein